MTESVFGRLVLVVGPEAYLAERAVADLVHRAKREHADVTIRTSEAAGLDPGQLWEMTGGALISDQSVVVVTGAENLPAAMNDTFTAVAGDLSSEVALVVVHQGGAKGKALLDKLRPLAGQVIDCPALKTWEMTGFASAEARRRGTRLDAESAQQLVDAVGADPRAVAGAVEQLASDAAGAALTPAHVRRYFAGRAEVTSFSVADDVMEGRQTAAVEKLRWALSTGVAPVLVTSALANSLRHVGKYLDMAGERRPEAAMAKDIGVPPWKVKDVARQARGWSPSAIGAGIVAVAQADADVKGAATDPEFALERLLVRLDQCRESAKRR